MTSFEKLIIRAVVVVIVIAVVWTTVFTILAFSVTGPSQEGADASAEPIPTVEFGSLNEIQIVETGGTAVVVPVLEETPSP